MQAGTTPKKRTSVNGRAALKLMRLDGARRDDQAASDARVTKAGSSIAVALLLVSSGASATECQSSPVLMSSPQCQKTLFCRAGRVCLEIEPTSTGLGAVVERHAINRWDISAQACYERGARNR
jgi:hypothetical protein